MWYFNGKPYTEIHSEEFIGFIYRIDFEDKSYIGKKQFYSKTTKKLGKKALEARTDKRLSKKQTTIKESNWKTYKSSNAILKTKKEEQLTKTIIAFATNLRQLTYLEVKAQFVFEVLESDKWYNQNILGRFFSAN